MSRIHESSIGTASTSTPGPQASRAAATSAGAATIVTGSWAATARATAAWAAHASAWRSAHRLRRAGHAMRVRSWGDHSAGIRIPSPHGVRSMRSYATGVDEAAELLASAVDGAIGPWVERSVARIMTA